MDAGSLGFIIMSERAVRQLAGYDFLCYCLILYDHRFRGDLFKIQKAGTGETLQDVAVSGNACYLSADRKRILCTPPDL